MSTIGEQLGPVEGFARRAGRDVADAMRELMHPHFGHHPDAPQPAAPAPTIPTTMEDHHMSLVSEGADLARQAIAKLEAVDHEALNVLERVQANPATAEAFALIGALTGLPSADFSTALSVLRMVLLAAGGQVPPQQA